MFNHPGVNNTDMDCANLNENLIYNNPAPIYANTTHQCFYGEQIISNPGNNNAVRSNNFLPRSDDIFINVNAARLNSMCYDVDPPEKKYKYPWISNITPGCYYEPSIDYRAPRAGSSHHAVNSNNTVERGAFVPENCINHGAETQNIAVSRKRLFDQIDGAGDVLCAFQDPKRVAN